MKHGSIHIQDEEKNKFIQKSFRNSQYPEAGKSNFNQYNQPYGESQYNQPPGQSQNNQQFGQSQNNQPFGQSQYNQPFRQSNFGQP